MLSKNAVLCSSVTPDAASVLRNTQADSWVHRNETASRRPSPRTDELASIRDTSPFWSLPCCCRQNRRKEKPEVSAGCPKHQAKAVDSTVGPSKAVASVADGFPETQALGCGL